MRLDCQASQAAKDLAATKADTVLQALGSKTPAQIDAYIDAQVTDLASARKVLKMLCKVVSILVRNGKF